MTGRWWVVAGVLGVIVVAWFLVPRDAFDPSERVDDSAERDTPTAVVEAIAPIPRAMPEFSAERTVFRVPDAGELSKLPPHPVAAQLASAAVRPADESAAVLQIFGAYRDAFGSYPSGEDNAQLMNALRGGNAGKRAIFARDSPRLNARGELLDAHGTAFFFHLLSSQSMEVRSAGADRKFYTPDDVVAADRAASGPSSTE